MASEQVINYIAGIMKTGFGLRGSSYLGTGEVATPENAMILSDKRVLFVAIPLPGAGKIIAGTDISMWQWLAARKDIENKLKEMLSSMSLQQILKSNSKNFFINLSDIKKVKISTFFGSITFVTRDNKKYKYSIRNKDDREKAKTLFQNYM